MEVSELRADEHCAGYRRFKAAMHMKSRVRLSGMMHDRGEPRSGFG